MDWRKWADFVLVWFVCLLLLDFVLFPLSPVTFGVSVDALISAGLGFAVAFLAVYRFDVSLPSLGPE